MIVKLKKNIDDNLREDIINRILGLDYRVTPVTTQSGDYLVAIGSRQFDLRDIGFLEGIEDVHMVSDDYQLVSRKWRVNSTQISLGEKFNIGEGHLTIIAGPCSIESEEQIVSTIDHLEQNSVKFMRGGVFKPRSSPYSFRGLGIEGLKLWFELSRPREIKIVTEVMQVSQIDEMYNYVDIFQVGARNTQNFNLLDALGKVDKPVILKRGISGTVDELLHSAEYVYSGGNEQLILCERGIRTYERSSRNTLDLNAIPILKEKTHLPIIVDPSHGIGIRDYVEPMALASIMAGADGIIYEVHQIPEDALSDSQQTISYKQSKVLIKKVRSAFQLIQELEKF